MSGPENTPIRAYIVNTDDMADMFADIDRLKDGKFAGKWHSFPTTTAELQATLKEIGVDGVKHKEYALNDFEGIPESLRAALPMFTELDEFNYLALSLSGLTDSQRETLEAALESGKYCESVTDVINLTENLDRFELQPAYTPEMYGAFLLETEKENTLEVFDRLEKSSDPGERAFAKYILRLEAYIDETDYGRGVAHEEIGDFTNHGYLTKSGEIQEVYRGPEDIPATYRVFAYPDPDPLMKVENASLCDLVLKMHALGGDYMSDARHNLNVLSDKRSAEYLMLTDGRNILLTEAAHAYRRGTTAFDAFMNTPEGPDTRAFAIHVTDVHNGPARGDVVEVSFVERQLDILQNSIHFTRVDATPKYGPDQSFTPEEWNRMESIDKHMHNVCGSRYHGSAYDCCRSVCPYPASGSYIYYGLLDCYGRTFKKNIGN